MTDQHPELNTVRERAKKKLERDMGPRLLAHLNDSRTVEIMLNADSRLWLERLGEPMSITRNDLIAYFPEALLRNSEFLPSSYHDVPEAEPEFIEELCRPSPDRRVMKGSARALRPRFLNCFARGRG